MAILQVLLSALAFPKAPMSSTRVLPVVDLGYIKQQATSFDWNANDIYTFSNIRYARAPTHNLRWEPPQPPLPESGTHNGSQDRICFQAQPYWQMNLLGPWMEALVTNRTDEFYAQFPNEPVPPVSGNLSAIFPPLLPSEMEDCLFLDVYVPRIVLEKKSSQLAPVMVWIHGGGLTLGSKSAVGNLSALVAQSMVGVNEPVIIVSINYRLGAFGFLGGPSLPADSGVSNVGLLDQEFALNWVKSYISRFGGSPTNVTVAGESAGGASIIHQIVSRGGKGPAPAFQKALIQSGGWNPTRTTQHLDDMYRQFLSILHVSSVREARHKSSKDIRNANFLLIYTSRWGGLSFGVEADGLFIPEPAPLLLASNRFHHNVSIMTGQNSAEGVLFASSWTRNRNETEQFMSNALPDAPEAEIKYIDDYIYAPPENQSAAAYIDRVQHIVAEAGILCQSALLARAFSRKTYNYIFSIPPAWHAGDLGYTFYDGTDPSIDESVARAMQQRFLSFIRIGDPNENAQPGSIAWEQYGKNGLSLEFGQPEGNGSFLRTTTNPGENLRCTKWWGSAFYSWNC